MKLSTMLTLLTRPGASARLRLYLFAVTFKNTVVGTFEYGTPSIAYHGLRLTTQKHVIVCSINLPLCLCDKGKRR